MNYQELTNEIESQEFALKLGIASGLKTLLNIALSSGPVNRLQKELNESPEAMVFLLSRILAISESKIDRRYVNPYDFALAIYLFLLSNTEPFLAQIAANYVLAISECWWAEKMSKEILAVKQTKSETVVASYDIPYHPPVTEQSEDVMDRSYTLSFMPQIGTIIVSPETNVLFEFRPTTKIGLREEIRKERILGGQEFFRHKFSIKRRNYSEDTPVSVVLK